MTTKHIIATALMGLATVGMTSKAEDTQAGDILQDINMFTPEEGDPAYKVTANEKAGTQWGVDMAFGYWGASKTEPGAYNKNALYLIHAQLNQRLIKNEKHGGTWLRVELSGTTGLTKGTRHADLEMLEGFGTATDVHGDFFGTNKYVLPEIALMQYFNNKKTCLIFGMVNLTNYFDAVGIANDSFSGFTNTGFMNTTIVPLVDSNLGAVLQHEINSNSYGMLAFSRTNTEPGFNPFRSGKGWVIVGEYGRMFADGKVIARILPFVEQVLWENDNEEEQTRYNWGLAGSIEYTPTERISTYVRTGWAAKQELGNGAEISFGTNVKLFASREDDFFGVAYGVFKPTAPAENKRESVLEVMYSFQVNDYIKLVPHFQYVHRAADRETRDATIWGVQTVFSF